ncbi:chitinase CLP-like [Rutidosis leptorrhynchoides]|uniref:chitinase CLP-like n=1 Tax=Rutidosis leptorrhynchoides TaxID=125765 RepID=UPI003A9913D1
MNSIIQLTFFILALFSHQQNAIAKPPYMSIVAATVNKHIDASKPLYSVDVMTAEYNLAKHLIDIDAPFTWHDCIFDWRTSQTQCNYDRCETPVDCDEYQCVDVRGEYAYKSPNCSPVNYNDNPTPPDYGPPSGYCKCSVRVVDPITGSCYQAELTFDSFTFNTSNGRNTLVDEYYDIIPVVGCAPSSSFQSFPKDVSGVMAFSTSKHASPAYLSAPLKYVLALCLPSTLSTPGALFYGSGSYYLSPQSNVDVRSYLSYTPLLKRPGSFGYFIGVNSIVIKKRSINITVNATTKLSTIDPYTTLRTDIYNSVVKRFSSVTKRIPSANPIAPFGLCYKASSNDTKVGVKVPDIDFGLEGGSKWTVSTANSMKQMTKDVACLAFVDGGATSEPAIVIGTFQFEDNFVMFNVENSTFGFSSSLLKKKTSCSNFNFTSIYS